MPAVLVLDLGPLGSPRDELLRFCAERGYGHQRGIHATLSPRFTADAQTTRNVLSGVLPPQDRAFDPDAIRLCAPIDRVTPYQVTVMPLAFPWWDTHGPRIAEALRQEGVQIAPFSGAELFFRLTPYRCANQATLEAARALRCLPGRDWQLVLWMKELDRGPSHAHWRVVDWLRLSPLTPARH